MNRVVHFELPAQDLERAAAFYERAFGWKVAKAAGGIVYWLLITGAEGEPGINGALAPIQYPGQGPSNTLGVADMDAVLAAVVAHGGAVLMPKEIMPGVGALAIIRDTEGNVMGLLQAEAGPPPIEGELPTVPAGTPRPVHFELPMDDPERAVPFYRAVFGWEIVKWEGPMEYWLVMTGGPDEPGIDGGLGLRSGPEDGTVNTIGVEDVDAALANVRAAGGQVVRDKMAVPGVGWMAYCLDTEGNGFGLMQEDLTAGM
jgi:hypothetical protein